MYTYVCVHVGGGRGGDKQVFQLEQLLTGVIHRFTDLEIFTVNCYCLVCVSPCLGYVYVFKTCYISPS